MKSNWKAWLQSLIPGIITAAVVFGPSKVTIASKMGAQYNSSLLWVLVIAIFFMAIYTNISSRIGLATENSILTTIRSKWGRAVSGIIGFGVFLVCTAFQAGNAVGVGIAIGEFTHTAYRPWMIIISIAAIALLFARRFYTILSRVMIGIVILMLFSFLVTCFLSHPAAGDVLNGLIPTMPKGAETLVIAFVASCFSIVGAFYQSYLVQQRTARLTAEKRAAMKDRSLTGMIILGIMSAAVMLCAAAVLHPRNIQVQSATDMGKALEPLFGLSASRLFLMGLFGSSFSALVGNSVLGGTVFSDALGWGNSMDQPVVKVCIAVIIALGAALAWVFGSMPLEMIVFAQGITILIVPVIGLALLLISCDSKIMGERKNTLFYTISAIAGLVLLLVLAAINIKNLFFK
ncbi:MAG: Nramp family divalent metal transporter [Niabella sp.]|nr:Nramp family divalent metal transporter [Niabella sp.]